MNTKLKAERKNDFENDFFKLKSNSIFEKIVENVRKHRDIRLVKTDKKEALSVGTKLSQNKMVFN